MECICCFLPIQPSYFAHIHVFQPTLPPLQTIKQQSWHKKAEEKIMIHCWNLLWEAALNHSYGIQLCAYNQGQEILPPH